MQDSTVLIVTNQHHLYIHLMLLDFILKIIGHSQNKNMTQFSSFQNAVRAGVVMTA